MANGVQPIDAIGIINAAENIKRNRQAQAMEQAQLARLYEQDRRLQEQAKIEQEAQTLDTASRRAAETQKFQLIAGNALKQNPAAAQMVAKARDAKVRAGLIDHFDIPGFDMMNDLAGPPGGTPTADDAQFVRTMSGLEEERYPQQRTREIQNWEYAQENQDAANYVLGIKPEPVQRGPVQREPGAPKAARPPRAPKPVDTGKISDQLRKEFQGLPISKDTSDLGVAFEKVNAATPTAAGDMGLIYGYMKLLDAGSSVKEGEYANAENAGGVPEKIRNLYNGAKDGQILAPQQRAQFKGEAKTIFQAQLKQYRQVADQYRELAKRRGVSPEDVVLDMGYPEAGSPPVPSPRTQETDSLFDSLDSQRRR